MIDPEPEQAPAPYRLAGEEAPMWLAASFALVGSLLAVAAAWLSMAGRPSLQEPVSPARPIQEQVTTSSAQRDIAHPAMPTPVPAETPAPAPSPAIAGEGRQDIRPEPRPPLGAPADAPAGPSGSRETATAERATPVPVEPAPKREECPPAITIPFKHGGAQPAITDDTEKRLARLREWLERHPGEKLTVEGHADAEGSERYNLLLSYRRAKTVVGFLDRAGVPERQITIFAAGETNPIEGIPADSEDNRRVILQVNGIENCRDAPANSEGP